VLTCGTVPLVESVPYRRQVRSPGEPSQAPDVVRQSGFNPDIARPWVTDVGAWPVTGAEQEAGQKAPAEKAGLIALGEPLRRAGAENGDARPMQVMNGEPIRLVDASRPSD
jgi:hypothetical protein